MLNNSLYDYLTGKCIRRIAYKDSPKNTVYLTFDDGPNPLCTPQVLDLLKKHQVRATFFLVGSNAKAELELTKRIQQEGHHIGNHSIDHDTKRYFSGTSGMADWFKESQEIFEKELQIKTIGFRSPAGIKTPPLNKLLSEKNIPLILWDVRFYDTKYGLSVEAVNKKLPSISSGSIILLHDSHQGSKQNEFLLALEHLIIECKKKALSFLPLEESMITSSFTEKYSN
jgi:peptidoglycan/xylan/chitin deacetylase (PgdA/CDA1 family)